MYRTMSGCLGREHLWVDGNSGHNGIPKERLGEQCHCTMGLGLEGHVIGSNLLVRQTFGVSS